MYTSDDVRRRERLLRVLLCAPPKNGKTTVSVATAPGPVFVFNTDGKGALDGVVYNYPEVEFGAVDIRSEATFKKGFEELRENLDEFKTVVFDNVTFYVDTLFKTVRKEVGRDDPRAIYPEVTRRLIETVRALNALPVHVIYIGQIDPGDSIDPGSFGHILAVSGKGKTLLPALLQDWLWLDTRISKKTGKPRSKFLLAPQGSWTKGSRSVQGLKDMPADFTEFLRLSQKGRVTKEDIQIPNEEDEEEIEVDSEEDESRVKQVQSTKSKSKKVK